MEEEETTGVAFAVEVAEREEVRQEAIAAEEREVSEATREGPDRRVEVQTVRHRRWTR